MDFVTAWKALSIALTGAFGILGLVKEFKDKRTGLITKWGRVSLAGIVLSTSFGLVAQLKEVSSQQQAREATAKQTLALAEKTDQAVRDLRRMLAPLEEPHIYLSFAVPCDDPAYKVTCEKVKSSHRYPPDPSIWEKWPRPDLVLRVAFFADAKDADDYLLGNKDESDLSFGVIALSNVLGVDEDLEKERFLHLEEFRENQIALTIDDLAVTNITSNGKIKSLVDLPGAVVIIEDGLFQDQASRLSVLELQIKTKDGQSIAAGPDRFERLTIGRHVVHRGTFPRS